MIRIFNPFFNKPLLITCKFKFFAEFFTFFNKFFLFFISFIDKLELILYELSFICFSTVKHKLFFWLELFINCLLLLGELFSYKLESLLVCLISVVEFLAMYNFLFRKFVTISLSSFLIVYSLWQHYINFINN